MGQVHEKGSKLIFFFEIYYAKILTLLRMCFKVKKLLFTASFGT